MTWMVAIGLSILSATLALGAIAKSKSPSLALSLYPRNGFAAETAAAAFTKTYAAKNQGKFPSQMEASWIALASQAFISEPTASDAVAVIALSHSDSDRQTLMRQAFSLSRRRQLVTGWLIADLASQQDIPGILRYYDTILRTNSSSEPVVIPIIANALSNDGFVAPLASLLRKNPPWAASLWKQVVSTPEAVKNATELRLKLSNHNGLDAQYRDADLVNALVSQSRFESAEELVDTLSRSENGNSIVYNGDFSTLPKYPPIDWRLISNGEFGAAINDGFLVLSAIPNSGGMFARQLIRLPQETVALNIEMDKVVPKNTSLYIDISCAESSNQKIGSIKIPIDGKTERQLISNTESQCQYYWISLFGRALETGNGFDVSVASIAISPVR